MTSELEALKRLLDTTSSPAPRDGASGGDVLPGEGAPKPASPLDVDAIMARFDATVGALAEESARADPVSSPTSAHASVPPAVASYDAHVTGAEENVQRLGAAMDDAERELDAAFARHRDSNKHAEALRDAELAASRADADAKQRALESLGVEVVLGEAVTECAADGVIYGGNKLAARTIVWAAGVRASRAAEWLNAPADRAHRLQVEPDLTVPGHPDIFAVGDTVTIKGPDGNPVPGIAPAAKQEGRYAAALIKARLKGETLPPFQYKHAGSLAQIGKRLAVIDFGKFKLRGALAWWIWGIAHIYFLIGLRNRLSVALSWLWVHARNQRAARLITQGSSKVAQ